MKLSLQSIGVLGLMLSATLASATQCPNLNVTIVNTTDRIVQGGVQGNTGNLGSSGYAAYPNQTQVLGVYAQNYPQGTTFGVVGNIQWYGQSTYENQSCTAVVPGVNGCPDPNIRTTMVISASTGSLATCKIVTQAIKPPPPPPPTTVRYEFINNLGTGTVVSATVGVTVTYHGNPTTATTNVSSGVPVKGQIAIPANSSSVYVAGLGVYKGIWGPGCGPTQYSNLANKLYVITFTNPSVVNCTVQQK